MEDGGWRMVSDGDMRVGWFIGLRLCPRLHLGWRGQGRGEGGWRGEGGLVSGRGWRERGWGGGGGREEGVGGWSYLESFVRLEPARHVRQLGHLREGTRETKEI